jgi:hypothetical protein
LQYAGDVVPIDFYTMVIELESVKTKGGGDVFGFIKQVGACMVDGLLCAAYAMGMDFDDMVKQ